jgi:hypothetical protein
VKDWYQSLLCFHTFDLCCYVEDGELDLVVSGNVVLTLSRGGAVVGLYTLNQVDPCPITYSLSNP